MNILKCVKNIKNILILSLILFISIGIVSSVGKVRKDELKRVLQQSLESSQDTEEKDNLSESETNEASEVKDELIVPRYKSSLTDEQRGEYMKWVEFKNSLGRDAVQLAKLTKYFAPEDATYYPAIYKSGWPFYSLAGIFGFVLLIYIIMRFGFRLCLGPKKHITMAYGIFAWFLICNIIILNYFYHSCWRNYCCCVFRFIPELQL